MSITIFPYLCQYYFFATQSDRLKAYESLRLIYGDEFGIGVFGIGVLVGEEFGIGVHIFGLA